jgi:5-methylcytosine-specific restriction protein A
MPAALLRACASPGCPHLTAGRLCSTCASTANKQRGSAASRGYGADWRHLRIYFRRRLIAAGLVPVCGARLPGAPVTHDSQCEANHFLVDDDAHRRTYGHGLHTDHIVPHGGDDRLRLDLLNLQLLCEADHDRKTMREQHAMRRESVTT